MALCECGCGQETTVATKTATRTGRVKGQPNRFVHGHNTSGRPVSAESRKKVADALRGRDRPDLAGANNGLWKGDKASYFAIHMWLSKWYPKTGVCEECGEARYTQYANLSRTYLRDRSDYKEMCVPCHKRMDLASIRRRRRSFSLGPLGLSWTTRREKSLDLR